jgi:hypothetical protein
VTQGDQATRQRAGDDANQASHDSTDHREASAFAVIDEGRLRTSREGDDEPAGEDEPPPDERDD